MPIPQPSLTDPIIYEEQKVWVKGIASSLVVPVSTLYNLTGVGNACVLLSGNVPLAIPGAGRRTFAVLYLNPAPAISLMILTAVKVSVLSSSAVSNINVYLTTTSGAPTGGGVAIPHSMNATFTLPDSLGMVAPTAVALITDIAELNYSLGITGAAPTTNPPPVASDILYSHRLFGGELVPPPLSNAAGRGFAVTAYASAATTLTLRAEFHFMEVT